jgi:hypothetical protein
LFTPFSLEFRLLLNNVSRLLLPYQIYFYYGFLEENYNFMHTTFAIDLF